jgi:hypothetical protein
MVAHTAFALETGRQRGACLKPALAWSLHESCPGHGDDTILTTIRGQPGEPSWLTQAWSSRRATGPSAGTPAPGADLGADGSFQSPPMV